MRLNTLLAVGALSLLGTSSFANLRFDGTSGGQNVNITYLGNNRGVFAGRLAMFNLVTSTSLFTYCGDLDNTISNGQSWNCTPILAAAHSANMGLAGSILATNIAAAVSDDQKAGLQLAIWEAVYDGGVNGGTADFGTGDFKTSANATILGHANTFYASSILGANAIYYRPEPSNAGQGQLGAVPEPASMAVLAVGVLAAARKRRKRA